MSELDILFPIPANIRNADDMGMPSPTQVEGCASCKRGDCEARCCFDTTACPSHSDMTPNVQGQGDDTSAACGQSPAPPGSVDAYKKDAARYRWLRDNKNAYPLFFIAQRDQNNVVVQFTGDLADMNIDEMMKTPNAEVSGAGTASAGLPG